jgi:signal peptidase II
LITLTAIVGIAAILIYARYPLFNRMLVKIALGLLLGGAVGNLIDRIRFGQVVDFIDVGAWPVFNLADSAIVVGVIIIIVYILFLARREESVPRKDE